MVETGSSAEGVSLSCSNWRKTFVEDRSEWMARDGSSGLVKTVNADSQEEAVVEALKIGVIPSSTQDVRPRQGGTCKRLMDESRFKGLMEQLLGREE